MQQPHFSPGLYDKLPNEQYHAADGISKSQLDVVAEKSMMHYWHQYVNPEREPREATPALIQGDAIHAAILQPDLWKQQYVQGIEVDKRTKAGKEDWSAFVAEHEGKVILTAEQYEVAVKARDAVYRHPLAKGLLQGCVMEQSFFAVDPDTGALIKCRTDALHLERGMTVDVKSTEDASSAAFTKSVANYRYDVQEAWYKRVMAAHWGEAPALWAWLVIEKSPPFAIGVYYLENEAVRRADAACSAYLERILRCREEDVWPDYGWTEALPISLPTWVKR